MDDKHLACAGWSTLRIDPGIHPLRTLQVSLQGVRQAEGTGMQ